MTVTDLIRELQKHPVDMKVFVGDIEDKDNLFNILEVKRTDTSDPEYRWSTYEVIAINASFA